MADMADSCSSDECLLTEKTSSSLFSPLHLISEWTEPGTTRRCISLAIVLPSGVGTGQFSTRVVEGGRELHVTVRLPRPLLDLAFLHKKWLKEGAKERMEKYHPKFLGFENALKNFRARASEDVESTASIPLPFAVETHIDSTHNLGWVDDNTRILYVDLKSYEDNYGVHNDENSFDFS